MKKNDVKVSETSRRGEGIARIEGLVTFIPNASPGDHVRVRITRISRHFAEAEIVTDPARQTEETEASEEE